MKAAMRHLVQLAFLGLFIALLAMGKIQLWIGVFLFGVLVSFFWSRLYCGWLCPINTVMEGVTFLKKKSRLKSFRIPSWLSEPWIRFMILLLFFLVFVFVMLTGQKLPILPLLFAVGITITLFFPAELWHRFLCPYGTILSLTGMNAPHAMVIDPEKCNNCTACQKACPAGAIEKKIKHQILKKDCLVCLKCRESCRQDAIRYR